MDRQKSQKQFIGLSLIIFLLFGCGTPGTASNPKPGAMINATINTGEKAGSGSITFMISDSGTAIAKLTISLKKANCQDMITMGSVTDFMSDPHITITNGTFEGSLPAMGGMVTDYRFAPGNNFPTPVPNPDTVGKITGHFVAPTSARGTITIYLGAVMTKGIACELGTFNWNSD